MAATTVLEEAEALEVGVLGGELELAAAGWEGEILVCFLLNSEIEREFLPHFAPMDRTPGCRFLGLYCLYLILNASINRKASRDRLRFLDRVLIYH